MCASDSGDDDPQLQADDVWEHLQETKAVILQGPPGTGKTHMIKKVVEEADEGDSIKSTDADLHEFQWSSINNGGENAGEISRKMSDGESRGEDADGGEAEGNAEDEPDEETENSWELPGEDYDDLSDLPVIWELVQLHPSYSYEDFVRGITIQTDEDEEGINFTETDELVVQLKEVAKHVKDPVILVLDEINRCNLADVLGELILTLEEDKRSSSDDEGWPVRLQYPPPGDGDGNFAMPDNLYVLGTMNTADQSIANIDYAIRRRFRFIDAPPDRGVIKKEYDDDIKQDIALSIFTEINGNGDGDDNPIVEEDRLKIGHSHFLIDDSEDGQSDNGDQTNNEQSDPDTGGNGSQNQSDTTDEDSDWAETLANRLVYDVGPLLREYKRAGELESEDATIDLGKEFNLLNRNTSQSKLKSEIKEQVEYKISDNDSEADGDSGDEDNPEE